MLNYKESNPTCANLMAKNGIAIPDKYTLKAVATMTPSQAQHHDGWKTFNTCILPKEARPSVISSTEQCNLIGKYIDETNDCKTTVAFTEFGQKGRGMNLPGGVVYNDLVTDVPEWNDVIRSVCVPSGQVFTAAQHPGFGGQTWVVNGPAAVDIPQYMREGGNMISALRVDGQAVQRDPLRESRVYTMTPSKHGRLPLDPKKHEDVLRKGIALYPNEGCIHPVGSDTLAFMKDASSILEYPNQVELYRLRRTLSLLMADCEELDRQIRIETERLNKAKRTLAEQQALCRQYASDLARYKQMIKTQFEEKIRNEALKKELNGVHIETRKSGKTIADKCNSDIAHCWAYQHCEYGGRREKMQGYIPDLVKYGFADISSLVIPPGIEVRIYDDMKFIGGNALYTAPLSGNGLRKSCLINDKYTQRKVNVSNDNISIESTYRNWNDNVRGMRVRRAEFYKFEPKGFVENFVDYADAVSGAVMKGVNPGDMDSWFYGEVALSVNRGGQDYLAAFQNKGPIGIAGDATYIHNVVRNNDFYKNPDVTKYFSQQELDGIPAQNCAKWCTEHSGQCDSFVFKKNQNLCKMYKSQGTAFLENNAECGNGNGSCTTYIGRDIKTASKPSGRWMPLTDIPKNDITLLNVASKEACAEQCSMRPDCKGMSFNTKPGARDCWLKNKVNYALNPFRHSWVKDGVNPGPPAPNNQQPAPKPAQPAPKPAPKVLKAPNVERTPPKPAAKAHKFTGKKIAFTIDGVDFYLRICTTSQKYASLEMKAANAAAMKDLVKDGFGPEFKFNLTGDNFLYTDAMKAYKKDDNSEPVHMYLGIVQDRGYSGKAVWFSLDKDGKIVNNTGYGQDVCKFEYKNNRIVTLNDPKYCSTNYLDNGCISISSSGYDGYSKITNLTREKGNKILESEPLEVEVMMEEIDDRCDKGCSRTESAVSVAGRRKQANDQNYNYFWADFQKVTLK